MVTLAPASLKDAARRTVAAYSSAVVSGIVPDQDHLDNGGYHVSINDLIRYGNAGDYSNRHPLDVAPPVTTDGRRYAAALDISVNPTDMRRMYTNVEKAHRDRATDTRTKYINAINVWSTKAGTAPVRFSFTNGTRTKASRDHEWHSHAELHRLYADATYNPAGAARAGRALASVWTGQTHDAWQRQEHLGPYAPKPPAPPDPPEQEDEHSMISHTYQLPPVYAYDPNGVAVDPHGLISIGLPPAGHPTHRWGKDYAKPYLSIVSDHIPDDGARIRVAINNGEKWTSSIITIDPDQQGRVSIPVPAPATGNQSAYNISVGRLAPLQEDTEPPVPPAGTIGVMIELIRKP